MSQNPLIPNADYDRRQRRETLKTTSSDNPLIPIQHITGAKRDSAAGNKYKSHGCHGSKGFLLKPDASQLAIINGFAKREMTGDELLVGQMRLANNCIDRDNERFSEEIISGFAPSIVRKTLLMDHDRNVNRSAIGKFFAAEIEKLSLERAIQEVGEILRLPDGQNDVWFLSPWFYIPKAGVSEQTLARLEAGIFDFASIGFAADRLVPITDKNGTVLFHEYQGRGEALEGSFVFLGAQFGASIKTPSENSGLSPSLPLNHEDDFNPLIPG